VEAACDRLAHAIAGGILVRTRHGVFEIEDRDIARGYGACEAIGPVARNEQRDDRNRHGLHQ
jgi:hypothetical protein